MNAAIAPVTARKAWAALEQERRGLQKRSLRELFAEDPVRGEKLTAEA